MNNVTKTLVKVGRIPVAQVQGLWQTEGLCLPGGKISLFFDVSAKMLIQKEAVSKLLLLTQISQIEGQLLPEAALELTKLEEDALLQVVWQFWNALLQGPCIRNATPRCSSVLDAQR